MPYSARRAVIACAFLSIGLAVWALSALPWLPAAFASDTDTPLFRWVDKQGVIHLTDRLGDVPEPYNAIYRAQLRKRAAAGPHQSTAQPSPIDSTASDAEAIARARAAQAQSRGANRLSPASPVLGPGFQDPQVLLRQRWQQKLEQARQELQAAVNVLQQAQDRLDELTLNPLIRLSPGVQEQIPQLESERDQAKERVQQAEKYLQEELPAQARKENIPMKWLL